MKNSIIILAAILFFNEFPGIPQNNFSENTNQQINLPNDLSGDDPELYCSSTYTNTTDDWISNVTFNSINNSSGQEGPDSYMDYTSFYGTGVVIGNTYNLSVSFVSNGYTEHVWAWIDWNGDYDFSDPGEAYDLGQGIDATLSINITVPNAGYLNWVRMRVIEQYNTDPTPCDPHPSIYGETEDYGVLINSSSYCYASGGCDEYINSVMFGNSAYSTGCYGYSNQNIFWELPSNTSVNITVGNGNPYSSDQCGIWIDWNKDNDFYDANETITVNGTPGLGPYTATIVPPPGIPLGDYTMRTRIIYSGTLDPCGNTTYGEVEDYVFAVTPEVPCTWTGAVDNNWHNPDNWNTIDIPDASTDVIIPDVTNKCWIYAGAAFCNNLTIQSGSGYVLRVYDKVLNVAGNMTISGELLMDNPAGKIITNGNMTWESGSVSNIQADAIIELHGNWIMNSGANVMMNNGIVSFTGAGNSNIITHAQDNYFNDISANKSSPGYVSISASCTWDVDIHGDLAVQPATPFFMYTPFAVYIGGDLLCLGSFYGEDGALVMNGTTQNILMGTGAVAQYFHNLLIQSSVSTSLLNNGITVNTNLRIDNGQLICNDYTISVGGFWLDANGPAGFVEGNGRVILTGYSNYIIGDENFNILELNKNGPSDRLDIDGPTVTCQQFDWTNGLVSVRLGGEFTAYDLVDDGIYGGWGIDNTGGTINISNYDGYVDLNGLISLTGGTMNVYGGTTPSYWPFDADAEIYMTDGVLDFHDQGIFIYNSPSYTLTENITGGTIRTSGGFWGENSNFSPDGGTMEFYGVYDANLYTINGSYLNDVVIDKATKSSSPKNPLQNKYSVPLIDKKSGKPIGDGTESNNLNLTGDLSIYNSLVINSGVLNSNGYDIYIKGDWTNNVGDAGFLESTGTVYSVGDDKLATLHTDETFNNLLLSNANLGVFGLTLANGVVVNVTHDLEVYFSTLGMGQSAELHVGGNMILYADGGLNAKGGYNILSVGGNWTNNCTSNTDYLGFSGAGELVTFSGSGDQILMTNTPEQQFSNLHIDKSGGYFKPESNIKVLAFTVIFNGGWWDNITGLTHEFKGDFIIESGGEYHPQGTTVFSGFGDYNFENNGGSALLEDLVIDRTGSLNLNSPMVVFNGSTTTINQGMFNFNGNIFKGTGDININSGGELNMNAGSILYIVTGLYVNNGGIFTAHGVDGNDALVSKDVVGNYAFEVNAGGTISADYVTFENSDANGIRVKDGATVDPANPFSNCTFDEGINSTGSTRLTIDNNQVLNIGNIQFNNNPYTASAYNITKNLPQGDVTLTNYSGDFAGEKYDNDVYNRVHWAPKPVTLDLKVLLEGPFNGTDMDAGLNAILPLTQPFGPSLPYFGNPSPDWYYAGSESVASIPNPQIVDWVEVQLRQGLDPASTTDVLTTQAAFVNSQGNVVGLDGTSYLDFSVSYSDNLYVAVWQRNHLGVISANPLTNIGSLSGYDFTTGAGQAVGGTAAQKQIGPKWVMMAGDAKGDGAASAADINNVWYLQAGESNYLESDFDMNGQVDNRDKDDYWLPNLGGGSFIAE